MCFWIHFLQIYCVCVSQNVFLNSFPSNLFCFFEVNTVSFWNSNIARWLRFALVQGDSWIPDIGPSALDWHPAAGICVCMCLCVCACDLDVTYLDVYDMCSKYACADSTHVFSIVGIIHIETYFHTRTHITYVYIYVCVYIYRMHVLQISYIYIHL